MKVIGDQGRERFTDPEMLEREVPKVSGGPGGDRSTCRSGGGQREEQVHTLCVCTSQSLKLQMDPQDQQEAN